MADGVSFSGIFRGLGPGLDVAECEARGDAGAEAEDVAQYVGIAAGLASAEPA